jgi:hypothetical protein
MAISLRTHVEWGRQADEFAGASIWVLPNPSGLNRAFDLARLTEHYREMKSAVAGTAPPSVMADPNKQPIVARHFPQTTPTALDAGHPPQFGLPDEVARS